jgi:hypothetical protein
MKFCKNLSPGTKVENRYTAWWWHKLHFCFLGRKVANKPDRLCYGYSRSAPYHSYWTVLVDSKLCRPACVLMYKYFIVLIVFWNELHFIETKMAWENSVCVFHTAFDHCWSAIQCVHLDSICHRSNAMGLHSHIRLKKLKHMFECKKLCLVLQFCL